MSVSKIAVITGASRGLGLALTNAFNPDQWLVVGTGRSEQPSDFPATPNVTYRQFDASDFDACEAFWRKLQAEYPDSTFCLVNNAGGYVGGSVGNTDARDYATQMQSIYFSAVYMTKALVENIPQAQIINIVSSSALNVEKNESAYGSAKVAEKYFFQSLQQEFAPEQYQITNLYPYNIASHGPNPDAINADELAAYVVELTESKMSHYLRDVTMYPVKRQEN